MVDLVEAMPLRSFEYGGTVRAPRKGTFSIDRRTANDLEARGLLKIVRQNPDPQPATGGQPSASPVAQASRKQTSNTSATGAKRGRRKKQDGSS